MQVINIFGIYYTGPVRRMLTNAVAAKIKISQTKMDMCLASVEQIRQMANGERHLQ